MARPMSKAEWIAAMTKWKVPVRYYPGWDTRGRPGDFTSVNGIVIHHTGSDSQTDDYLKFLFVIGRPDEGIPGPLCNVSTDMDGDLWVGAAGRANHAGKGSSATLSKVVAENYPGYTSEINAGTDNTDGNAHFYGNEVRFDGGQPMTTKQWNAAVLWAAAICDHYGWTALSVIGHREWTDRKPDPGSTKMYEFRAAVKARLTAGPNPAPPTDTGDTMADLRTDIVGNDADGTPTTFAERSIRDDFVYRATLDDGKIGKALNDIQTTLADVVARLQRIEDDTDDGTVTP